MGIILYISRKLTLFTNSNTTPDTGDLMTIINMYMVNYRLTV